jgi:SAM-dependent methyltransferase
MTAIDFACGTGYWTEKLLTWGMSFVTGVDISTPMINIAKGRLSEQTRLERTRLIVGDGSKLESYAPDGTWNYFNLAFGGWFLNYAPTKADLESMFRNVARNLQPDGTFVAVVPYPTEDFAQRIEETRRRELARGFPRSQYTAEVDGGNGWSLRVYLNDEGLDLMTWHMKKSVYEDAARLGGFGGLLEWRRQDWFILSDEWKQNFDFDDVDWKKREENPHFGILVVRKS